MSNVIRAVNPLKAWIVQSREEQRKHPRRYLAYYASTVICDEKSAMMSEETYLTIKRNCGTYDGTIPTGKFCGKMFLRGACLCWFGIDKQNPMQMCRLNIREIVLTDG